jgi:K+-sensing histidine kinase KdpD
MKKASVLPPEQNVDVPRDKSAALSQEQRGMQRLLQAVQDLSHVRTLKEIMEIVRHAARELTGADGASFVLRDNEQCYYADEDAIGPLWKGQRFPLSACISGWAMLNKKSAVIADIYNDPRVPVDAYRPTFVKSLVMVPIRTEAPVGAIGNYWATPHTATAEEVELLQALANTTAVAMENVTVYAELEQRVRDRTLQLESANSELEAFSYSVSHDLQAPLRAISGFSEILSENLEDKLDGDSAHCLKTILAQTKRMTDIIADLLRLSRLGRSELRIEAIDMSRLTRNLADRLKKIDPQHHAKFKIQEGLEIRGDAGLIESALENLLSNAWKYSSKQKQPVIEFGQVTPPDGVPAFFVRDNGAGFEMKYAAKLFAPFQRFHSQEEFPGNGIGLATVQRIIHRHGGRIWADSATDQGATFFFTLPQA